MAITHSVFFHPLAMKQELPCILLLLTESVLPSHRLRVPLPSLWAIYVPIWRKLSRENFIVDGYIGELCKGPCNAFSPVSHPDERCHQTRPVSAFSTKGCLRRTRNQPRGTLSSLGSRTRSLHCRSRWLSSVSAPYSEIRLRGSASADFIK